MQQVVMFASAHRVLVGVLPMRSALKRHSQRRRQVDQILTNSRRAPYSLVAEFLTNADIRRYAFTHVANEGPALDGQPAIRARLVRIIKWPDRSG